MNSIIGDKSISAPEQKVITRGFGIGGYRSYAQEIQWLDPLGQVNVIIGENNLGKSNMLLFIAQEYSLMVDKIQFLGSPYVTSKDLNEDIPDCRFLFGMNLAAHKPGRRMFKQSETEELVNRVIARIESLGISQIAFEYDSGILHISSKFVESVFDTLDESEWESLAHSFDGQSYNNNAFLNARDSIRRLLDFQKNKPRNEREQPVFIPAKRETNRTERLVSVPRNCIYFDGSGLGKLVAEHKNAGDDYKKKYPLYEKMLGIVRESMGDETIEVNVPYGETWVQVKIRNEAKRLETLGTGIQEIILVAAAAAFHSDRLICIEEPETHLHPAWLKRLISKLFDTDNQYFIATHSASIIDIPNVSVFQLEGSPEGTKVTHAVSARQKAEICDSLGYKPSDLMQTNCIIWVEGPSDRVYINHWLKQRAPDLIEGVHYTLMIYGGSLGTHITAEELVDEKGNFDYPEELDYLINVRRLNHRLAIVLDSDKKTDIEELTPVKKRLIEEFDKGPGFAWVTGGRSIENYFSEEDVLNTMNVVHPRSKAAKDVGDGIYRLLARLESKSGKHRDAKKVRIAECLIETDASVRDELKLDLEIRMEQLIDFIRASNANK